MLAATAKNDNNVDSHPQPIIYIESISYKTILAVLQQFDMTKNCSESHRFEISLNTSFNHNHNLAHCFSAATVPCGTITVKFSMKTSQKNLNAHRLNILSSMFE